VQVPATSLLSHVRRDAVSAENHQAAGRCLFQGVDEVDAPGAESFHTAWL